MNVDVIHSIVFYDSLPFSMMFSALDSFVPQCSMLLFWYFSYSFNCVACLQFVYRVRCIIIIITEGYTAPVLVQGKTFTHMHGRNGVMVFVCSNMLLLSFMFFFNLSWDAMLHAALCLVNILYSFKWSCLHILRWIFFFFFSFPNTFFCFCFSIFCEILFFFWVVGDFFIHLLLYCNLRAFFWKLFLNFEGRNEN